MNALAEKGPENVKFYADINEMNPTNFAGPAEFTAEISVVPNGGKGGKYKLFSFLRNFEIPFYIVATMIIYFGGTMSLNFMSEDAVFIALFVGVPLLFLTMISVFVTMRIISRIINSKVADDVFYIQESTLLNGDSKFSENYRTITDRKERKRIFTEFSKEFCDSITTEEIDYIIGDWKENDHNSYITKEKIRGLQKAKELQALHNMKASYA